MTADTFTEAVDIYLNQSGWIGDDEPLAFGLREAAAQLDQGWVTSLWAEFNKTIKHLDSLKPQSVETVEVDPLLFPSPPALETRGT